MASGMALKRKACDGFEQQSRAKTQSTSSRDAGDDLMSRVNALIQHSQRTGNGINDNNERASAHTDRTSLSFGDVKCEGPHNSSSADEKVARKSRPVAHNMTTRRLTKFMTFGAVLNTGELLEQIIYNLPPEAIVRLRRVNKTWSHIILTHRGIRRKIFLDPQPLDGFWVFDTVTQRLHPYVDGMSKAYGEQWGNRQSYCRPVHLNTMLFKRDDRAENIPIFQRATVCESLRLIARPHLLKQISIHRHMNRKRQGLLSQTLCTRLKVTRHAGVRLGDILNEFVKRVMAIHLFNHGPNSTLPRPDLFIRVAGNTRKKTTVWTLGGIFVNEEEAAAVEKLRDTLQIAAPAPAPTPLSPQAMELIKANNGKKIDFGAYQNRSAGASGPR